MTERTQRAHRAALTAGLMAALTPFAVAFQDTAEPTEEVDEWTALDREIQALDNLDFYDEPAAELWGYTRVSLFQQDDSSAAGVNPVRSLLRGTAVTEPAATSRRSVVPL